MEAICNTSIHEHINLLGDPGTASFSTDIRPVSRFFAAVGGGGKLAANDLWRHPLFSQARWRAVGRRFRTILGHARLIIHCLLSYRVDEPIALGMQKRISTHPQAAVRIKITRAQALRILNTQLT